MHPKISEAIGPLLIKLQDVGVRFGGDSYSEEAFGNFHVDCIVRGKRFRLIRDRSQYLVDGDIEQLKGLGLWRAYNSPSEYAAAVVVYASSVI